MAKYIEIIKEVKSVVNKSDEVKELLKRNMCDILFLAETKVDSTVPSRLVSHPGFRTIRKDHKKGDGGLLAYIRNELSEYRNLKLESSDSESIFWMPRSLITVAL